MSHTKLGKILGERQVWFDWLGRACILDNIRSGKIYIGEEEVSISHMPATVSGFKELEGIKARGHCEAFCTPGRLRKDEGGNFYFVRESFSTEYCNAALEDPHLLGELPNPHRILTVPFPFLDRTGKKLVYPGPGYDPHFNTYMVKDAPEIDFEMPLNRAKEILAKIHEEFCFLNAQSKVHAFARLITPFARGLWDSSPESRFGSIGRTVREPARITSR